MFLVVHIVSCQFRLCGGCKHAGSRGTQSQRRRHIFSYAGLENVRVCDHYVGARYRIARCHGWQQACGHVDLSRSDQGTGETAEGESRGPDTADCRYRKPFMSSPVMELDDLRSKMLEHHARYVPILEGEKVVGVISFHDVAKAVLEERNFENRMLKGYIKDWPAEEKV